MKKILVLVAAVLVMSAGAFASSNRNYEAFVKLNNKAARTVLMGYIDADHEQSAFLQHVIKVTEEEMKNALEKENFTFAELVLRYNLRNARIILSEDQYRKYLVFVNIYLNNENNFRLLTDNNR